MAVHAHRQEAEHTIFIIIGGSVIINIQPIVLRPDQHELSLNTVGTQVTVLASNVAGQS